MIIRPAEVADVAQLLELYLDLVGDAPLAGELELRAVIEHPGTTIWVAEQDEKITSMATLHCLPNVTQSGRCYALIENVVTRTTVRKAGYGRAVMDAAIAAAWAQDAYKIMLMTGKTAGAKGFYQALGFNPDEKWAMTLRRAPVRKGRL